MSNALFFANGGLFFLQLRMSGLVRLNTLLSRGAGDQLFTPLLIILKLFGMPSFQIKSKWIARKPATKTVPKTDVVERG